MSYRDDFVEMLPNLLMVSAIICLVIAFPFGFGWFLLAVLLPFLTKDVVLLKSFKHLLKVSYALVVVKTLLYSTAFYWLVRWLGRFGVWGFIIVVLGFSGYKLFIAKGYYMSKVREIEVMIWGKTNDRKKR